MPFDFNPITGQLDLVDSTAGYIDGVVADPTALPVTLGTPPLDSVYLAKAGSGVWLINRKPAGLYVRVANNGVAADWQFLGAFPEVNADGNWALYNSATPSKELKFDLSGISASTVRTLTVPDKSGTIATTDASDLTSGTLADARLSANVPLLDAANTFSANQTLDGTNNVAPNQTAASGASIMTRALVDARVPICHTVRLENNQTAADAANFYSLSPVTLPLDWVPAKIEIHAELEFTTTPLAAGVSNFRFRLTIRDVEGAVMNATSHTSAFNADSVSNVTGDRYVIKGEITSFPATWSTRLATHGTIFLVTDGTVFNFTGGSLTLVNNQDRRVGYRIFR